MELYENTKHNAPSYDPPKFVTSSLPQRNPILTLSKPLSMLEENTKRRFALPRLARPIFCASVTERVYITAGTMKLILVGGIVTGQHRVRSRRTIPRLTPTSRQVFTYPAGADYPLLRRYRGSIGHLARSLRMQLWELVVIPRRYILSI